MDSRRWRFAAGLVVIALLYTSYIIYCSNLHFVEATSRGVRHVVRFSTILLTYGIGLLVFARVYPNWLVQLWHIGYLGMLSLLLLLGIYDFWAQDLSVTFRDFIITVHELLISPIPYVIAGLVYRLAGAGVTSS
jgi:glucan phosphoethanolaminetransferase (alkaline phosphatase superfamily)